MNCYYGRCSGTDFTYTYPGCTPHLDYYTEAQSLCVGRFDRSGNSHPNHSRGAELDCRKVGPRSSRSSTVCLLARHLETQSQHFTTETRRRTKS